MLKIDPSRLTPAEFLQQARLWPWAFKENFDPPSSAWNLGDRDTDEVGIKHQTAAGGLRINGVLKRDRKIHFFTNQPLMPQTNPFYLSVEAHLLHYKGNKRDAFYGLKFLATKKEDYYLLINEQTQQYRLVFRDGENWKALAKPTRLPQIKSGRANQLEIIVYFDNLYYYINGHFVERISLPGREREGDLGLSLMLTRMNPELGVNFAHFVSRVNRPVQREDFVWEGRHDD